MAISMVAFLESKLKEIEDDRKREMENVEATAEKAAEVGGRKLPINSAEFGGRKLPINSAEVGGRKLPINSNVDGVGETDGSFPWFERKRRFLQLEVFKEPKCLIFQDETEKLDINMEVVKDIEIIDVPLSIVAIVGLYRTGKSYLMNRLAGRSNSKSKGFELGHTTRSKTKGIWIWCVIHPTKERQVLVFVDTEGLADPKKVIHHGMKMLQARFGFMSLFMNGNKMCYTTNDPIAPANKEIDKMLFCLTVLMSSTLIYNVKGVFDADAIEKLSFISKMSETIQVFQPGTLNEEDNEKLIGLVSPLFILCLRDFYLDMAEDEDSENNTEMTEEQYLESCLSSNGANDDTVECIRKFFPNRTCFKMSQPTKLKKMKELDKINDEEIDDEFITEMSSFKDFIINECEPKKFYQNEKFVDGLVLGSIVITLVNALRRGSKLIIEEAYSIASEKRNSAIVDKVKSWFTAHIKGIHLPIPMKEDLQNKFFEIHGTMIQMYRTEATVSEKKFEDVLIAKLKEEWRDLRTRNTKYIQEICKEKLDILQSELIQEEDKYNIEGGYILLQKHVAYLKTNFYSQMKDYDKDELDDALQTFHDRLSDKESEIFRKDELIRDIKLKERMNEILEKRLQEKYELLERENDVYIKKERQKLVNTLKANTSVLEEVLEEKRSCILS